MAGSDEKLYILAFDHRGSFQKKWFGIEGDPTEEEVERIADAKQLVYEGLEKAVSSTDAEASTAGGLVDEQFGAPKRVPERIKEAGMKLAMPVEKSGQKEFDFEHGDDFGEHIESFDPDFTKVLVRYNPEGDAEMNRRQGERLARLSSWLKERDRKLLFELLVPAEDSQLESVGGDQGRYDDEVRPALMAAAIQELQNAGIESDIWKIEGLNKREDCERIVEVCRAGGRDHVTCVVLGRGADSDTVDHWLATAADVEGYIGFAIGRSIWGDGLTGFLSEELSRDDAVSRVAENYVRFIRVYEDAAAKVG